MPMSRYTCIDWAVRTELYDTTPGTPRGRMVRQGNGRRGYPIIETIRMPNSMSVWNAGQTAAMTVTSKRELIQVSEDVLDDTLFIVPPDYRPALQGFRGPDMTKQGTLTNRVEMYWHELVAWTNRLFRE
jgi:hypothetical protein